jgi:hypothetical protein
MRRSNKLLTAVLETSYGNAPVATGADVVLATDVALRPMEGQDISRNLDLARMGAQETLVVEEHAVLSFEVELAGSGSRGTPPAWGRLLRACGVAETVTAGTSVVYTPVSQGFESLTLGVWIGSTYYVLPGARGTAQMRWSVSSLPRIAFTFTGDFTKPAEVPRVGGVNYAAWKDPKIAKDWQTRFSLDGTERVAREVAFDLGCSVEPRFVFGRDPEFRIASKSETIDVRMDALPVTEWSPFDAAFDNVPVALTLDHDQRNRHNVRLEVPRALVQRPSGLEGNQDVVEWPLTFAPVPADLTSPGWRIHLDM